MHRLISFNKCCFCLGAAPGSSAATPTTTSAATPTSVETPCSKEDLGLRHVGLQAVLSSGDNVMTSSGAGSCVSGLVSLSEVSP